MSAYQSGKKANKKGLKIALFVTIALLGSVALVLGLFLGNKEQTGLAVLPENNVKIEKMDSDALLSADGWNNAIALKLYQSLQNSGENVALGNAGGVLSSKEISLGGYSWSVVFKQNGVVTLFANEPVAYLNFDNASLVYRNSAIREYLNGTFYQELIKNVGFSGFADMIVPYGADELYYQTEGAQAVIIDTLDGDRVSNNDGVYSDKIWLPSVYEVGGFANTEKSPKARVNSFRTITSNGVSVNSGLWNLSNASRLAVNDALLRSNSGEGVSVLHNGVVVTNEISDVCAIRPCFNIMMPEVVNGVVKEANATTYKSNALMTSATADFSSCMHQYTTETSGTTFTAKSGNVTVDGVTYTNSQMLLKTLETAVNLGQTMSGFTFNLSSDVDMSVFTVWRPIGCEDFPFSGVFNGNGYKISNLCGAGSGLVGLFGYVSGSGADIKNVAVVDSSWYTTNNNVGGIVGILGGSATVEICYSECGISGENYVGGIVGKSTGTSYIKNCYNKYGVAGAEYVGGIIGSNGGSTISTCYNVGAVGGKGSYLGGIVGEQKSGSLSTRSVYYKEVAGAGNAGTTVTNSYGASYSEMQGIKQAGNITKPAAMDDTTDWEFSGSPWMISATLNDHLPMLKVFVKTITINVRSNDSINQVSVGGTTFGSTATYTGSAGSGSITITARASFSGTNHYKLSSWDLFDVSVGDTIVSPNITYSSAGTASDAVTNYKTFSISVTADDSYNFEAVFEKLYSFEVSPIFNGFTSSTTYVKGTEFDYSFSESAFADKWYPANTTATLTIGSPSSRYWKFARIDGSINSGSTWSDITSSLTNSGSTYTATIGSTSLYGTTDIYTVRPVFNRYYKVTLQNDVDTISGAPTIATKMVVSSPSATVTTTGVATDMIYNGTLSASITTTNYSAYYTFKSWQLLNGSTALASSTSSSASGLGVSTTQSDSVINLTLKSTFSKATKTISIKELVGETETKSAGIVVLSTSSTAPTMSSDSYPLGVSYGTTVYVYILPTYSAGYKFKSFSGNSSTTVVNTTTGLIRSSISATSDTTYNVVYELANFNITYKATLDGADSTKFTFSGTSTGNINTSISNATVANSGTDQYVLTSVEATYKSKTGTVTTLSRPSTGYASQSSYSLFSGLTTQTIAGLLSKIGATAVYNDYGITVTAKFIGIVRTITVNETWYGVTSTNTRTTLSHATAYSIQDTTASKTVTGQGTYNNSFKLTATPGTGYKVDGITATPTTVGLSVTLGSTYGDNSTATFTLSDNVTINITYSARVYTITATDDPTGVGNSFVFKIAGSQVTSTSNKVYVNYGNTVSISGYQTLKSVSGNANQKYELRSIAVTKGSSTTYPTIGTEWSETCTGTDATIQVKFNYVTLQKVSITLSDDTTATGTSVENVLVVLKSNNADNPNIVILAKKGTANATYADCVLDSGYTVSAIVPVYVGSTVTGNGLSGSVITITSSSTIDVKIKQDLQNASVFSAVYFG